MAIFSRFQPVASSLCRYNAADVGHRLLKNAPHLSWLITMFFRHACFSCSCGEQPPAIEYGKKSTETCCIPTEPHILTNRRCVRMATSTPQEHWSIQNRNTHQPHCSALASKTRSSNSLSVCAVDVCDPMRYRILPNTRACTFDCAGSSPCSNSACRVREALDA